MLNDLTFLFPDPHLFKDLRIVQCSTCSSSCKNEKQLKLHQEMYCNLNFDCNQCEETFPRISMLASHIRLKHDANCGAKTREIFVPICGKRGNQC